MPTVLARLRAPVVIPKFRRQGDERSAVRVHLSAGTANSILIEESSLAVVNVTSGRGGVLGLGGGGSRSRGLGGGGSNVGGSRGRSDVDRGRGGSLVGGRSRSGSLVGRRSGLLGGRGRSDGLLGGARGGGRGSGGSGGIGTGEDGQGGGLLGVGVGDRAQVLASGRGDVGNTGSDRGRGTDELLREATRFSKSKSCARRHETRARETHSDGGLLDPSGGSDDRLDLGTDRVRGETVGGPDLGQGLVGQDGVAASLVVLGLAGTSGLTDVVVTADGDVSDSEGLVVFEVTRSPTGGGSDVDRSGVGDVGADLDGSGRDGTGQGGEGNNSGLGEHFVDDFWFCVGWLVGGECRAKS